MGHWFLCARDVMWAVVAVLPIFLAFLGGYGVHHASSDELGTGFSLAWGALFLQVGLLAALYSGAIK